MAVDLFQFSLDNQDLILEEDPAIVQVSDAACNRVVLHVRSSQLASTLSPCSLKMRRIAYQGRMKIGWTVRTAQVAGTRPQPVLWTQ